MKEVTDKKLLEDLLPDSYMERGPGMYYHPDYLERIQLDIPDEIEERDWIEETPERENYDGPVHEIYKDPMPDSPHWEDSDYRNIASLIKAGVKK